ncbi:hypothetical protein D3I60_05070 [Brevibacterium permense]|uniref:hypothetical protein n=1 Tax=Brevibacterium permense TaxID=234834 RepID=UPI0021D34822|nr:hypothetical protein [Brevibacterium permense]MCU4296456.1 hypothetical protein [Brevibacterium permense]
MNNTIGATHEDNARPAHDSAKSALTKAHDALTKEREALSKAQDALQVFNRKLDSSDKLPRNAAHDGGELEAAVSFHSKRVDRAEQAATEAQTQLDLAHHLLIEAQVLDRAEAVAAFDYDELVAGFQAETKEIVDRYIGRVYDIEQAQNEAISLGRSIGLDDRLVNPENRARISTSSGRPVIHLDHSPLYPVFPSQGLDRLRESIRDQRADEARAEAIREDQERRAAEAAERQAQREAAEAARLAQTEPSEFRYTGSGGRPMKFLTDTQATPMGAAVAGRGTANHPAGTKRHG